MTTTVYLIRHGESEANVKKIIQGHADFKLTASGLKQAEDVAAWMKSQSVNHVLSSDLLRAEATAHQIATVQNLPLKKTIKLREIGLGPLEGKTREQIYKQFPDLTPDALLISGIEGTESVLEITLRCKELLEDIKSKYKDESIALVSHGGFISIFLLFIIAGERWSQLNRPFMIGNTGVTKLLIEEDKISVEYINQTNHLGESR